MRTRSLQGGARRILAGISLIAWLLVGGAAVAADPARDVEPGSGSSGAPAAPAPPKTATPAPTPAAAGPMAGQGAAKPERAAADKTRATPSAKRPDRLELDKTVVTGNRELPKVLYIVPWKRANLGDLPGQPFNSLLDEALTPVDRDVFRRELRYYDALEAGAGQATESGQVEK